VRRDFGARSSQTRTITAAETVAVFSVRLASSTKLGGGGYRRARVDGGWASCETRSGGCKLVEGAPIWGAEEAQAVKLR